MTKENQMTQTLYNCNICNDIEFVPNKEGQYVPCSCREVKYYQRILECSGIEKAFRSIGFKDFESKSIILKNAKNKAIEYVKIFKGIENCRENSIAFLGNPGSGKTHLSIAIANNLMSNNIAVLYMPYREVITRLKQIITFDDEYAKEISKYKNARVLLIDDLFKGKITDSDLNIMFDIINHRYLKQTPIIISSEYTQQRLLDFDEAIGSRIIQICKNRICEFIGIDFNYRLKGDS